MTVLGTLNNKLTYLVVNIIDHLQFIYFLVVEDPCSLDPCYPGVTCVNLWMGRSKGIDK